MYFKVRPEEFERQLSKVDLTYIEKYRYYGNKTCYMDAGELSGFAITRDGMLCHVFSLKKGLGTLAVREALRLGANRLNCYNSDLPKFYQKFGFKIAVIEKMKQGPDKIWMIIRKVKGALYAPDWSA